MSIEKHFEKFGVQLTEDNVLPLGNRKLKMFKRVIQAVRAAEGESRDQLDAANDRCQVSQQKLVQAMDYIRKLEAKVTAYELQERMQGMEHLTIADRQKILGQPDGQKQLPGEAA